MYQAHKSLGQHFLIDQHLIQQIVQVINVRPDRTYVEIGPGLGALTKNILPLVPELHVIEFDKNIIPLLEQECAGLGKLTIHQADVLKVDFKVIAAGKPLQVFGNLPYNISTPILFHLLEQLDIIDEMCFMLQKEVVDRMAAQPNTADYGRLTVMLQYCCAVEKLFTVPPEAFRPPPKVFSALVRITPKKHIEPVDHKLFSHVVNIAFQQRRKTIRNSLKTVVQEEQLINLGLDPKARAENLSVEDFIKLTKAIKRHS